MKSTCNANASLFDANAFQMQCKCNTNAFVIFHIIANASKFHANASYFYANASLLQDIKEIYIISLYIPFHYIYRERGKIPFRPQNRDKFQGIWHFFPELFAWFVDLSYFCGAIHTQRRLITANNNHCGIFYAASENISASYPRGNL